MILLWIFNTDITIKYIGIEHGNAEEHFGTKLKFLLWVKLYIICFHVTQLKASGKSQLCI